MTEKRIPENERYDRQVAFAPIGEDGQRRLRSGMVVVVGCGGLGTHIVEKLARAGVGALRIIDHDRVEASNLQRQALFTIEDALHSRPKARAAAERLREINDDVRVEACVERINADNVEAMIGDATVVLDGLDNLATRFILNDACRRLKIPFIHGGAVGAEGEVMVVLPDSGPSLRGVFEQGPDDAPALTCNDVGIIGPLVQFVAAFQAAEAIKILTGNMQAVSRDLVTFDIWENRYQRIPLSIFPDDL